MWRVWVLTAFFVPTIVFAQNREVEQSDRIDVETAPRPSATALRTNATFVIDGQLDEPVWSDVTPLTGFVQSRPDTGAPASQETVVRFAYTEDALFIGIVCHDSEPHRLVVPSLKHLIWLG